MTRTLVALCTLALATPAVADAPILSARSAMPEGALLSVWGTTRGVGAGAMLGLDSAPSQHLSGELQWNYLDRAAELRGGWTLGLKPRAVFTASLSLGPALTLVPVGGFDLGLGGHAGFFIGLGGTHFRVDLGVQSGIERFTRTGGLRFAERLGLGLQLQFERFTVGLLARAGADLEADQPFVGRAELALALGYRPPR